MVDVSGVSVFTKHVRQGPQPRTPYATSTARSDGIEEDYQVVENQGNLNLVLRSCNCPYFVNPRATSFFFILHFPSLGLHNKLALNQISYIGHKFLLVFLKNRMKYFSFEIIVEFTNLNFLPSMSFEDFCFLVMVS